MSNDDSRVTPPGNAQPRSSRARSEESPSGADAFVLPEFDSLPDLAPLPDLDEFLKADPLAGFDDAVAAQADTISSRDDDALPSAAPAGDIPSLPTSPSSPTSPSLPAVSTTPTQNTAPTFTVAPSQAVAAPTHAAPASSRTSPAQEPNERVAHPAGRLSWGKQGTTSSAIPIGLAISGAIVVLSGIISSVYAGGSNHKHPTLPPPDLDTKQQVLHVPGYRGAATNTHSLSPEWASGVATAWTIPTTNGPAGTPPQIYVDGSVLYLAADDLTEDRKESAVTVSAYDLSGNEPTLLWTSTGPTENSAIMSSHTPAFLSDDDQVFFHDVVIDKATGAQTQAPWKRGYPLAVADDIVVTCSATTSCAGWTREGSEWTNLWTTSTAIQSGFGLHNHDLGYAPAGTALAGSGAQAAVLVPTAIKELPLVLNVHTGEVTTLNNPNGNADYQKVEVATDGFLVYERSEQVGLLFEPNGTLQSTFTAEPHLPTVSHDGRQPTTSDIHTFMTSTKAPWAAGTIALTGTDQCAIEYKLTADSATHTISIPSAARPDMQPGCYFDPADARVSVDGSALYIDTFNFQDTSKYFIDTAKGLSFTSNELNEATHLTWVFDDMLIGQTDGGIRAFVPASS